MSGYRCMFAVLIVGIAVCFGMLAPLAAPVLVPGEGPPSIEVLQLEAYPTETSANKLSPAYTYPEVRFINARLRVKLIGFRDMRKLSVFITTSEGSRVFKKKKLKQKLLAGTFEFDVPEMLDLKTLFGKHKVKLYAELSLPGAREVKKEVFFRIEGRELPQVEVLAFRIYPGFSPYAEEAGFAPGGGFVGELAFQVSQPGEKKDMERVRIRLLGLIDDEDGFSIDPEERYQDYDTYWDEMTGPRHPGTYLLTFHGYFPRYFYESGVFRHPFTFHAYFYALDEMVYHATFHDYLMDRDPGEWRETDEEVLRTVQLERARRWRLRSIPRDSRIEEELAEGYIER